MKIEKNTHWLRFELCGEIDLAWCESHSAEIELALEDCPALVVFDVERVNFIDSTGLSLLVQAYHACQRQDGEVCVLHPQPIVARVLGAAGLDQLVTVVSTCEEARGIHERMAGLDLVDTSTRVRSEVADPSGA